METVLRLQSMTTKVTSMVPASPMGICNSSISRSLEPFASFYGVAITFRRAREAHE